MERTSDGVIREVRSLQVELDVMNFTVWWLKNGIK